MRGFSSVTVAHLVGTTYRVLDYWDRTGVLRPSLSAGEGSGRQRIYSEDDVRRAFVLEGLRHLRLSMPMIGEQLAALALETVDRLYVSPRGRIVLSETDLPPGAVWVVVDLGQMTQVSEFLAPTD